ncbi:AraC family ligand binding domain-containing protein, partial [Clostridium puniceum]|uniref:AraC family ligand binding domain-containing protein n=1 Tax=Clostridium puniceum TaxID=29367 RepID=UPI0013010B02
MNYSYEIVTTPKRIPAKIVIHTDPGVVLKHWHKDLELTYLYKGSATFSTNGRISSIGRKELFLVNSGDVHSVIDYSNDVVTMITILISYNFIKDKCPDIDNWEFKLEGKNKSIKRLKNIHEEIVNLYIKDMEINNT